MTIEPLKNSHIKRRRGGVNSRATWRIPGGSRERMGFYGIHRGCVDKATFSSKKTARAAAKNLGMRVYKCSFCGAYHLTSHKEESDGQ